jgi:hypothetical protein
MARQPVGIAVAMARHPQQLHFVKTCQRVLGVGDQWQQAGDEGALAASDLADGDTAVTAYQKLPRASGACQNQRGMQGTQLGLIVATTDTRGGGVLTQLALR